MVVFEARENRRHEAPRADRNYETKNEEQPTNTVNAAINKELYSKDDDVKISSVKIVISETVRDDSTRSLASQVDIFATVCGFHGTSARSVIIYPSQQCWSHGFSVDDSLAYMEMDAEITAKLSLVYEQSSESDKS